MKLKTEIIALCDNAFIDQQNKVSIIGIFDELRVTKFPGGFIDKFFVATINGTPNTTYELSVQLQKDNKGKNLLNPTTVNARTSHSGKHNMIIRLANVGFESQGEYYFKIYDGEEVVSSTLLRVIDAKLENKTIGLPN